MHNEFMKLAIKESNKALKKGEIPVGAIIVKNDKIISKAYNLVESKKCALYHAEILAIKKAAKKLKNWRLIDCEMYVTLEPCNMCKRAIAMSRIKKVYFSTKKINSNETNVEYINFNVYKTKTTKILKEFFKKIR